MIVASSSASFGLAIQGIISAVVGTIISYLGGWDTNLEFLLIFMLLDILSGVYVSLIGKSHNSTNGHYNSSKFAKGIFKKVLMLCIVALAFGIDQVLHTDSLRNITVVFFIINEAISVIENAQCAGVPIPNKIVAILEVYHEGTSPSQYEEHFFDRKILTKSKLHKDVECNCEMCRREREKGP